MVIRRPRRRKQTDEVTGLYRESVMLRKILFTTPDHVYVFDRQLRYRFASRAGANVLGLRSGGMVGKTWQELGLPAEVMEPVEHQLREVFSTCSPITGETYLESEQGLRFYEYSVVPITESGNTDLVMVTGRDVTERKAARQALEKNRDELEQRVVKQERGLSAALAAVKREGTARQTTLARLVRANRQLRMLGELNHLLSRVVDEDRLLRETCRLVVETGGYRMAWIGRVLHDSDRSIKPVAHFGFEEGFLEACRFSWAADRRGRGEVGTAVREQRPAVCADLFTDPDFEPWREEAVRRGYGSSLALPIQNGGRIVAVLAILAQQRDPFDDVELGHMQELANNTGFGLQALRTRAEHERSSEALRQNRARYRAMVMGQVDAVCRWLPDTTLSFVNESFCSFYGEDFKDVVGKQWTSLFIPRERREIGRHFKSQQQQPRVARYEFQLTAADGKQHWQEWVDVPITDGRGHVVEFQSVGRDITERKQTEARLRESESEQRDQAKKLQQKNLALREILTQIEEEKLEIKRQVSANVESVVMPALEHARAAKTAENNPLDLLELSIKDLSSRFGLRVKEQVVGLSPREVEVCNMIRHGMSSKEISDRLHISLRTVETHRNTIRKKLGVSGKKVNLATYLRNMG